MYSRVCSDAKYLVFLCRYCCAYCHGLQELGGGGGNMREQILEWFENQTMIDWKAEELPGIKFSLLYIVRLHKNNEPLLGKFQSYDGEVSFLSQSGWSYSPEDVKEFAEV